MSWKRFFRTPEQGGAVPFALSQALPRLIEWREFAQPRYCFHYPISHVVNLSLGVKPADTETNRTVCQVIVRAKRLEHIRSLQCGRRTCRTTGNGYIVDSHQQRLAFYIGKAHVQISRQAVVH